MIYSLRAKYSLKGLAIHIVYDLFVSFLRIFLYLDLNLHILKPVLLQHAKTQSPDIIACSLTVWGINAHDLSSGENNFLKHEIYKTRNKMISLLLVHIHCFTDVKNSCFFLFACFFFCNDTVIVS